MLPRLLQSANEYQRRLTDVVLTGAINPFVHYAPRGAAAQVLASTAPEVVISGPAGTGKSRACLEKLNFCALAYPGMRGLIVRKTRESLTETGLVTFERDVLGLNNPLLVDGPQRRTRQIYRYPNGSDVVVGGLDKPGKVLSGEYDLVYVQQAEEFKEDDWEVLTTRVRNGALPFQQVLGCCNPDRPTHWLKRRCDAHRTVLLESQHEDNPVLWDGKKWTRQGKKYLAVLDSLTGPRYYRLRLGRWVQAEGLVYEGWDATVHLVDRFEVPSDWRRIRSVDFGFTNPFVCQWWAVDQDGRMYLYREIYHTKRTVRVHAEEINRLSVGEDIEATVCDHDAEDMATLLENGIYPRSADKAVSVGLQRVQERLKVADDGKPRLFIMRDSLVEVDEELRQAKLPVCTAEEVDGYVWESKASKDAPVKEHDHGMDAMRYAVMYVDGGSWHFL